MTFHIGCTTVVNFMLHSINERPPLSIAIGPLLLAGAHVCFILVSIQALARWTLSPHTYIPLSRRGSLGFKFIVYIPCFLRSSSTPSHVYCLPSDHSRYLVLMLGRTSESNRADSQGPRHGNVVSLSRPNLLECYKCTSR